MLRPLCRRGHKAMKHFSDCDTTLTYLFVLSFLVDCAGTLRSSITDRPVICRTIPYSWSPHGFVSVITTTSRPRNQCPLIQQNMACLQAYFFRNPMYTAVPFKHFLSILLYLSITCRLVWLPFLRSSLHQQTSFACQTYPSRLSIMAFLHFQQAR